MKTPTLKETMRQFHVSRAQVNARLQRGGASADEKHHVKMLQQELHDRLDSYSVEAELPREALLARVPADEGDPPIRCRRRGGFRALEGVGCPDPVRSPILQSAHNRVVLC